VRAIGDNRLLEHQHLGRLPPQRATERAESRASLSRQPSAFTESATMLLAARRSASLGSSLRRVALAAPRGL
jgi:hypothetical protein